jgi:hypothetical protein
MTAGEALTLAAMVKDTRAQLAAGEVACASCGTPTSAATGGVVGVYVIPDEVASTYAVCADCQRRSERSEAVRQRILGRVEQRIKAAWSARVN